MNKRLVDKIAFPAFIAVCACAAVLIFLLPVRTTPPASAAIEPAAAPQAPTLTRYRRADALQIIAERPLFQHNRRPVQSIGETPGDASIDGYRLAGTISTGPVRKALFASKERSSEMEKSWKREGELIGGWRIKTIEPGRVTVSRNGETVTLSIAKSHKLTPKQESQRRAATPIYLPDKQRELTPEQNRAAAVARRIRFFTSAQTKDESE